MRQAYRLRGVVQGVGFRPHVAKVAADFSLSGFVGNDDESVFIEAQGKRTKVDLGLCLRGGVLARVP